MVNKTTDVKQSVGSGIASMVSDPVRPIITVHYQHPIIRISLPGSRSFSKKTLDFEEISISSNAYTGFKPKRGGRRPCHQGFSSRHMVAPAVAVARRFAVM